MKDSNLMLKKHERRGYGISEAAIYLGIGRQTLYNKLKDLPVKPKKWGAKWIFTQEQLDHILDTLPTE